jgi:hypothetical protein
MRTCAIRSGTRQGSIRAVRGRGYRSRPGDNFGSGQHRDRRPTRRLYRRPRVAEHTAGMSPCRMQKVASTDSDPRSERSSPSAAHPPSQANPTDQIVLALRTLDISPTVVITGIRTVLSNSRRPLSGCRDRMRSRGRRSPRGSCRSSWPV